MGALLFENEWMKKPGKFEIGFFLLGSLVFVILMGAGDTNGIGIFQQPYENLAFPIMMGILVNMITLYLLIYRIIPQHIASKNYALLLLNVFGLFIAVIIAKTLIDWLAIKMAYPRLRAYSFEEILTINIYSHLLVSIFGVVYGLAREFFLQYRKYSAEVEIYEGKTVRVTSGKKQFNFKLKDIKYLKAEGNYVKVVCSDRNEMVYNSLTGLEKLLPQDIFLRVHRSYIVSRNHITTADKNSVEIETLKINVGAKYQGRVIPNNYF